MAKIRVGIVGLGNMGRVHQAAWRQIPQVDLVGCVSRSKPKDIPAYLELDHFLRDAKPDLVSVCTPTDTHPGMVSTLLDFGCDVICEKPLALDVSSAERLAAQAQALSRKLGVAHVLRYFPQYQQLAQLIRSGVLGDPVSVRMRRAVPYPVGAAGWFGDEKRSGGVVFDLLIHDVDFLVGSFGVPKTVFARRADKDRFCSVIATLNYSSGMIAHVEGLWGGATGLEFSAQLVCSAGEAELSSRHFEGAVRTRPEISLPEFPVFQDPYRVQLEDFLRERESSKKSINLDQAISSIRLCENIARSIRTGTVVETG